jgi:hypothetical protein
VKNTETELALWAFRPPAGASRTQVGHSSSVQPSGPTRSCTGSCTAQLMVQLPHQHVVRLWHHWKGGGGFLRLCYVGGCTRLGAGACPCQPVAEQPRQAAAQWWCAPHSCCCWVRVCCLPCQWAVVGCSMWPLPSTSRLLSSQQPVGPHTRPAVWGGGTVQQQQQQQQQQHVAGRLLPRCARPQCMLSTLHSECSHGQVDGTQGDRVQHWVLLILFSSLPSAFVGLCNTMGAVQGPGACPECHGVHLASSVQ